MMWAWEARLTFREARIRNFSIAHSPSKCWLSTQWEWRLLGSVERPQLKQATDLGQIHFSPQASVSPSLKWTYWLLPPWRVAMACTELMTLQLHQNPSHDNFIVSDLGRGTPLLPSQYTELTPNLSNLQQHYSNHYDRDCVFMAGL